MTAAYKPEFPGPKPNTEHSECHGCGRALVLTKGKVLHCLLCGADNTFGQDIDAPKPY